MKPSPVLQRPLGQKHLQRDPWGNLSAKGPEVPTRWAWVGSRMVRCGVVAGDPHPHSGEGKGNLWGRPCADVPTNADLPQTEGSLETARMWETAHLPETRAQDTRLRLRLRSPQPWKALRPPPPTSPNIHPLRDGRARPLCRADLDPAHPAPSAAPPASCAPGRARHRVARSAGTWGRGEWGRGAGPAGGGPGGVPGPGTGKSFPVSLNPGLP